MELRSVSTSWGTQTPGQPFFDGLGLTGPVAGLCMYMLTTLVTKGKGIRGVVS